MATSHSQDACPLLIFPYSSLLCAATAAAATVLDFSNEPSARARTSTGVAPPPAANSPPLRSSATGLPGSNQLVAVVVNMGLDDHLQKEGDEPEEGDHCAKTSNARPNQPSQAAESSSLMSFLALVALISAWIFRRRLYPGAKHELLLPKERHCQRRTRDHELKWSEPLDGRYRYVRVVGVMYLAPCWCPGPWV